MSWCERRTEGGGHRTVGLAPALHLGSSDKDDPKPLEEGQSYDSNITKATGIPNTWAFLEKGQPATFTLTLCMRACVLRGGSRHFAFLGHGAYTRASFFSNTRRPSHFNRTRSLGGSKHFGLLGRGASKHLGGFQTRGISRAR